MNAVIVSVGFLTITVIFLLLLISCLVSVLQSPKNEAVAQAFAIVTIKSGELDDANLHLREVEEGPIHALAVREAVTCATITELETELVSARAAL